MLRASLIEIDIDAAQKMPFLNFDAKLVFKSVKAQQDMVVP